MGLTLLTPPTDEPVTLAEAKAHLRVRSDDEDTHIEALISSASRYIERYVGMSLTERTWKLTLDAFSDNIELKMGPVTAVTAVEYLDEDGATQEVDPDYYTADLTSNPQWVVRNSAYTYPTPLGAVNSVFVTYTAGYETVPAQFDDLRMAILLMVGHFYMNREAVSERQFSEVPLAVEALASPFRLPTIA